MNPRSQLLIETLKSRILVLDGAMGTAIQGKNLSLADFGGAEYEGCNENLVLTRPDVIQDIHESYLKAGCDIVETNTFGATRLVLDEYHLSEKAAEINFQAASLARAAAARYHSTDRPRFVAGSIGPTTKAISVTGGVTFATLEEQFYLQAKALWEGGVDYLLFETCQDTRNIKAGLLAVERLFKEKQDSLPMAISVTIEPTGTMLAGQTIEALLSSVAHRDLLYLGLNCATGPLFMTDAIRSLAQLSPFPVACVPNAGLPDENGHYLEGPEKVGEVLSRFVSEKWINVLGGCCGTHAGHIETLSRLAAQKNGDRRVAVPVARSVISGIDYLEITDEMRPIIVGERTNVIGSKKFKKLICEEKFEEAAEIARAQVKSGAHLLDICLANLDRDEFSDCERFLEILAKKVRVPFMLDSTDERVLGMGLTYSQGKAILNSINLEDGEERFEKVVPLIKSFGAAVVVGLIDEDPVQGMAITRARKVEIAERSFHLLTEKYGLPAEDIYWDPLVFPCGTNDPQYIGSAIETIEGIRLLKQRFPATKTVLGISNVSFGLPTAGREVLNSVFLYLCVQAGLDLAIVSSQSLKRYSEIPEEERALSRGVLYNEGADPVAAFAAYFRSKTASPQAVDRNRSLPLNERLSRYIVEGSKDGLIDDLKEAQAQGMAPLEIINGPLMKGMDEVGKLFNTNQLIIAEVLQSAEAMKAAVKHLEPFMEKTDSACRGKVLLATVKGDVHDIGKNLVEIILGNNGFRVIDLGIRVPPEQLIQAVQTHQPDIVGLSGLLVKSAHQMVTTAEDLSRAGVCIPMLVGGAALSSNFVHKRIAPAYAGTVIYASDAMMGLDLAKSIVDPVSFEELKNALAIKRRALQEENVAVQSMKVEGEQRSPLVEVLPTYPQPPDFSRHALREVPAPWTWEYINPMMIYGRHLGLKGEAVRLIEQYAHGSHAEWREKDPKSFSVWNAVQSLKEKYRDTPVLKPQGVYQFFLAGSQGNCLYVARPDDATPTVFKFPRQLKANGLCLSDYVQPVATTDRLPAVSDLRDNIALFIVTVGKGVRALSEEFKQKGEFLNSHVLQVLALESAEGFAERLHGDIRALWGFPDAPEMTLLERFQAKYRGKRYSFGYPACP